MPTDTSPSLLSPNHFPKRLADLGFAGQVINGMEVITPPLCNVPAGPFLMGSDKRHDKDARDDEQPQHTVTLAAYQIARYPVTVAEYACYVRATGQQPNGWQSQVKELDHPVINVSWNDAQTYVRWLAQVTGQAWLLPTEAEWEKAARGTDGRIYPWGDIWETLANTWDSGPHRTTPVGAYPGGASPYGAKDMAGAVWEWCSSLYQSYPHLGNEGRENLNPIGSRCLRGGSWRYAPQLARTACRGSDIPDSFGDDFGFRVVLASRS